MWMYSTNPCYVFVHVPRTGGQSIWNALYRKSQIIRPSSSWGAGAHESEAWIKDHFVGIRDAYSFGFVRNPWDRAVSLFYRAVGEGLPKFKEFWANPPQKNWIIRPQIEFVKGVSFVGRFERLQQDFEEVCQAIGIAPFSLEPTNGVEHPAYRDFYDEEAKELISSKYAEDIDAFGYSF